MRGITGGVRRFVQYAKKNPNCCYTAEFEGDGFDELQLVDPETSNESEVTGEALFTTCKECGLPKLIRREGSVDGLPEEFCECEDDFS